MVIENIAMINAAKWKIKERSSCDARCQKEGFNWSLSILLKVFFLYIKLFLAFKINKALEKTVTIKQ